MKRSRNRTTYATDSICTWCGDGINYDSAIRSNTWWKGMIGVRVMLCTEKCRDEYDVANMSHIRETMEDE